MIGYISGKVMSHDGNKCIVLTSNGVGYEVSYNNFRIC
jgi:Holliday junction resolvasome RuvABC DNA-binding subunit